MAFNYYLFIYELMHASEFEDPVGMMFEIWIYNDK